VRQKDKNRKMRDRKIKTERWGQKDKNRKMKGRKIKTER
jgi:hypothetical protein